MSRRRAAAAAALLVSAVGFSRLSTLVDLSVCSAVSAAAQEPSRTAANLLQDAVESYDRGDLEAARLAFDRALAAALEERDRRSEAAARRGLGLVSRQTGHNAEARRLYLEALAGFEALGDRLEQARILHHLAFVADTFEEREQRVRNGLELLRGTDHRELEGQLFHTWGDAHFIKGEYDAAMEKYDRAAALLEQAGRGARGSLARLLTSLGRVHRAHGNPQRSLDLYRRALAIQRASGDKAGEIQSHNALGVTYAGLERYPEARAHLQRALSLARESGNRRLINFQLGSLGSHLIATGEYRRGADVLEELLRKTPGQPYDEAYWYDSLSEAYLHLGRHQLALDAAGTAVARARASGNLEKLPYTLFRRARAHQKLGLTAEALTDAREGIDAIGRLRSRLVPSDFMKRGFGDQHQALFTLTIELEYQTGLAKEALETAEQARARAFVDLLATREVELKAGDREPELRSSVAAPSLAASQMATIAARLHSTILSYWVAPEATFIWVVRADGAVHVARVDVSRKRLASLVRQTWAGTGNGNRGRPTASATDSKTPSEALATWAPRVRGADLLSLAGAQRRAGTDLYNLLVRPVRRYLPVRPGSLLTIVPHGPLFLLSFAGLPDGTNRYLLESYTLHYAPSAAVLRFTERKEKEARRGRRYLLVADPERPPAALDGQELPPLPGSRREVEAVATLLPRQATTILTGAEAHEAAVRSLASATTVLHFATHGVIRDDRPLDSFLALAGRNEPPERRARPARTADDGRLTAEEIYGLDLKTDLVVLSACRTALGKISGDGIVGLVRGFLYAGTPTVVATLSDVADEPASLLLPEFYQALNRGGDKSRALRAAQLTLLMALRRGEVTVATDSGSVALPEHPVLWASFVVIGEP